MPVELAFADGLAAALKSRPAHVALFAPRQALDAGVWNSVFTGERHGALVAELLEGAQPGGFGRLRSTLTGLAPGRVSVAVLPDRPSRHACPARGHAIADCAGKLELEPGRATALVLCVDGPEQVLSAVNAVARSFPLYARQSERKPAARLTVAAIDRDGEPLPITAAARATAEATRWIARLVDTPTSELSAAEFVSEARAGLRGLQGVRVRVVAGEQLERLGLGGLAAVGRAASVPPRLLLLEHGPRRARRTVALVGKGVVYDTGGLSLKIGGSMPKMKGDMGGGGAVLGAFRVLAQEGLPGLRLVAAIPLAENAIGPASYRNDDILTLHSGKTVEINNTDAEGRLLLADGVSYVARTYAPDLVIDAATLTGAQLVATGKRHAAIVSNRDGVEALAVRAGRASGDLVHPLPFAPELYQPEFKSPVADMRNSVADRANAQSSCAAQFVYSHIQDLDLPWLHVDLAGPAFPDKRGTGFGVALIAEVVRSLEARDLEH